MDQRKERVEKLTRDIMALLHEPAAEPAAFMQCPNCSHRFALILAEAQGGGGASAPARRGRAARTPAKKAAPVAVKQRKPPTIGPVLQQVRKLASHQRVVTGKIFKAMNAAIGDTAALSKTDKQKRQLEWLKKQFKPAGSAARKKAARKTA